MKVRWWLLCARRTRAGTHTHTHTHSALWSSGHLTGETEAPQGFDIGSLSLPESLPAGPSQNARVCWGNLLRYFIAYSSWGL